jgi:predicted aldo/keto reductase-like oxidoreductase
MEERPYGKTGEKFPILSFGAMSLGELSGREAEALNNKNNNQN